MTIGDLFKFATVRSYSSPRSLLFSSSSQTAFNNRLESYIDAIKKGRATTDAVAVSSEIFTRDSSVSRNLAAKDPRSAQLYNNYLSGMRYDRAARLVSTVEFGVRSLNSIPTQEQAEAATKKIVEAFKKE